MKTPTLCLFLISLFLSSNFCYAQNYHDSLDLILTKVADQENVVGFAGCIINDSKIKYAKGFGWADEENKRVYTSKTIQNIASISKTFIGVSLMIAQEKGMLDLDDPIENYLPYKIVNPKYPDKKITIRHLATHTSSLNDPEDYERAYIFEEKIDVDPNAVGLKGVDKMIKLYNSNQRVPMDDFVKSIYIPGGKYYSKKNFLKKAPGEKFEYSNIGAGIASKIIEKASGMFFPEFTQQYIFDPLQMNNSIWELAKADRSLKATPYLKTGVPLPHYELITFADGGLITSVEDLGLFVLEMMNCYNGQGDLLKKEQAKEMMSPYLPDAKHKYGIFWEISASGLSIGHTGGDPGTMTSMFFIPTEGVAKIMFTNAPPIDKAGSVAITKAWRALKKYQNKIQ